MKSSQKRGTASRRTSFHQMLDLEKRQKLDRMQASSTPQVSPFDSPVSREEQAPKDIKPALLPAAIKSMSRAMTAPNVNVTTPNPSASTSTSTPTRASGDGPTLQLQIPERDRDDVSDVSSICHSPGWDNTEAKRRKKQKQELKEKRRKEKEKIEKETRQTAKQSRLKKPPPSNQRFSNRPIPSNRTISEPIVRTSSDLGPESDIITSADPAKASIEVGLREWIQATGAVPVSWKTPFSSSKQDTKRASRFIGGLRLQLADEATVKKDDGHHSKSTEEMSKSIPPPTRSNTDMSESSGPHDSSDSSTQQPLYHETIARPTETHRRASIALSPTVDRRIKLGHNSSASINTTSTLNITGKGFTHRMYHDDESKSSGDLASFQLGFEQPENHRSHNQNGSERAPGPKSDEVTERGRGRKEQSYVSNQRQQSRNRSIMAFTDEVLVSNAATNSRNNLKDASKRPSSGHSSGSCTGLRGEGSNNEYLSSPSKPNPRNNIVQGVSKNAPPNSDRYDGFFTHEYQPPQLQLGVVEQPDKETLLNRRRSSRSISMTPTFKNIRTAAKAAFSRHSSTATSPISNYSTTGLPISSPALSPTIHNLTPTFLGQEKKIKTVSGSNDLCEGESIANAPSSITTLSASRPESQDDYCPPVEASKQKISRSGFADGMSARARSKQPQDISRDSSMDSWSRTVAPFDLNSEEDRQKTPTSNATSSQILSSLSNSLDTSKSPKPNRKTTSLRHHTFPQSQSSPDLPMATLEAQLSIDVMEHSSDGQPLRKLKPEKKRNDRRGRSTTSLIGPSPVITPKDDALPVQPSGSGQYLRDARVNLPLPYNNLSRSPKASRFSNTELPTAKPLAKMFVVCCSCRYFHDMPSKIYECMAKPDNLVKDAKLGVSGVISTAVKCPWCSHGMSITCCAGYAAVVYLQEKLH